MANIELIIWDFDGVLVDSEYIAGQETVKLMAEFGVNISLDEILRKFIGTSSDQRQKQLAELIGMENLDCFKSESKIRKKAAYLAHLKPSPYVDEMMSQITLPMCIGSNSSLASIQYKLEITNLNKFFSDNQLYVGSMFSNPKPAPDIFLHAAKQNDIAPENCLVIEDSALGTTAAVAAGMPVIGYCGASHCYQGYDKQLIAAGSLLTFDDMRDLTDIISKL